MSTTREEAVVALGLDTTKIKHEFEQFGHDFKHSINHVAKEFLGAFTAGGIIEGIHATLEHFEQLKNSAEDLGISTDFLQGMRHISSKEAVGGVETFNRAIAELSKNLGEAKEGSGEAIAKFEKWGITLKDIKSLNAEEMAYRISDSLKATTDPAVRVAEAFELMGKGGKNMVGVLAKGSEELRKMVDATDKLDAEKVKELAEAAANLKDLGNTITVKIGQAVGTFAEFFQMLGTMSTGDFTGKNNSKQAGVDYITEMKKRIQEKVDAEMDAEAELEKKKSDDLAKLAAKKKAEAEKTATAEEEQTKKAIESAQRFQIKWLYAQHQKKLELQKIEQSALEKYIPTLDELAHSGGKFGGAARQVEALDRKIKRDYIHGDLAAAKSDLAARNNIYDKLHASGVAPEREEMRRVRELNEHMNDHLEKIADFIPDKK